MYIKNVLRQEKLLVLEFDDYVPLTVQVGKPESGEIYLRYVSDYSLLELGVSPYDGTLTSLKLVQAAGLSIGEEPIRPSIVEEGLPLFDVSLWKSKRLLDIELPVELFLVGTSVLLIFDRTRKAEKLLRNQNLNFAVSDGYLCWALLENLTDEQIMTIREAIEQNAPGGYL